MVFMLPWLDQTIAGTTDSSTEITMRPQVGAALSVWAPGRMPQAFGPYSTWGCLLWVRSIVAGPAAAEQQQAGALHIPRCASTLRPQAHARAACQGKSYWVLACCCATRCRRHTCASSALPTDLGRTACQTGICSPLRRRSSSFWTRLPTTWWSRCGQAHLVSDAFSCHGPPRVDHTAGAAAARCTAKSSCIELPPRVCRQPECFQVWPVTIWPAVPPSYRRCGGRMCSRHGAAFGPWLWTPTQPVSRSCTCHRNDWYSAGRYGADMNEQPALR